MTALPDWLYPPPQGGWTVDDLDRLPEDAPRRVEIIDGALIMMSPQTVFDMRVMTALEVGLRRQAPGTHEVLREYTAVISKPQGPEPDVLVVPRTAVTDPMQTRVTAGLVVLAVEVVSEDSKVRDYGRKQHLYAEAGIPHYWIVDYEQATKSTRVSVYERDQGTGAYVATGLYRDLIDVQVPFPITLDLSWGTVSKANL